MWIRSDVLEQIIPDRPPPKPRRCTPEARLPTSSGIPVRRERIFLLMLPQQTSALQPEPPCTHFISIEGRARRKTQSPSARDGAISTALATRGEPGALAQTG